MSPSRSLSPVLRVLLVLGGLSLFGVPAASAESGDEIFAKYPAPAAYKGNVAAVDLTSHKDAQTFRTRLREAAKGRPNFAGHMIVVTWGCGTSCQVVALIDARYGTVYFGPTATAGIKHRLDSRLLIVNPPDTLKEVYGDKPPEGVKAQFFLWGNGKLTPVK